MKADWEKLMAEFKDSKTALIADVDCTADGKSLCDAMGVQGFPTIKYGDPNDLQDYQGGRKFDDLSAFAKANLGPQCGPKNLDLCDDAKKADIAKFSDMSVSELDEFIAAGKAEIEELEAAFKAFVGTLDAQVKAAGDKKNEIMPRLRKEYQAESDKKDEAVAAVKASGMGLAKSVKAFKASTGKAEL
mmetsp:Transcript_102606/g.278862  ORF Transcript_102606/g.278862 Transcript_102606/m.278862 type:complete len:188 (-) Transcript_102606:169-732(-)